MIGRCVWVMRDEGADGPLSRALRAAGLEPVVEPVIVRRAIDGAAALIGAPGPDAWLVLTSTFVIGLLPGRTAACRVAVVGAATRRAAEAHGLQVVLESPDGTGSGLWRRLGTHVKQGDCVVYPRSALASPPAFPGVEVRSPVVYVTERRRFDEHIVERANVAAVTSPSTAGALANRRGATPRCASIGPTTSASLRKLGIEPWVEPPRPTFEALAWAIRRRLEADDHIELQPSATGTP